MIFAKQHKISILLQHFEYIYKVAFRYTGNGMDAEDLTQETFYQAQKYFSQLKDTSKAKNWLFTILRNLYLKEFEQKRRSKQVDIEQIIKASPADSHAEAHTEFSDAGLQRALDLLEEKYKTPLLLFYFSNSSYREITEILDMPIGTVMSRISRAKTFLRGFLNEAASQKETDKVIFIKRGAP